jgi:hypothetical protein
MVGRNSRLGPVRSGATPVGTRSDTLEAKPPGSLTRGNQAATPRPPGWLLNQHQSMRLRFLFRVHPRQCISKISLRAR